MAEYEASDKVSDLLSFVRKLPNTNAQEEEKKESSPPSTLTEEKQSPDESKKEEDIIEEIKGSTIPFYRSKHIQFILKLQDAEESYEYCQTEHLRMQASDVS